MGLVLALIDRGLRVQEIEDRKIDQIEMPWIEENLKNKKTGELKQPALSVSNLQAPGFAGGLISHQHVSLLQIRIRSI